MKVDKCERETSCAHQCGHPGECMSLESKQRAEVMVLAVESSCDPRTARRFLSGLSVVSTMRMRLERDAARLKIERWGTKEEEGTRGQRTQAGTSGHKKRT
jgi:BRCT domain type II-containing protein